MRCPDANLIAAFVGGTLDPARAEQLAGHLDGCEACDELVAWSTRAAESSPVRGEIGAVLGDRDLRPRDPEFGRYILLELIGAGGMGVVYAAFDPRLDRKVALKLVWDEDAAARASIEREARLAARLQHPNAIAIYDVGAVGERVYLAMEYVDGATLAAWVRGARTRREVLGVFVQAARGLAAAHRAGLVHRDFKPSNALVGNDGRVRVLDFGLARAVHDAPDRPDRPAGPRTPDASGGGSRAGSPAYMAPEQLRGEPAGPAADQFAFCVALHEALYGTRPFAGDSLDELAASVQAGRVVEPPRGTRVPPWLRRVILRGLRTDAGARFASMEALAAALGRDPTRARRAWIAVGVLACAAGVGVAGHARAVHQRGAACDAHEQRMRVLAGPEQARRVRAAFAATGASFAAAAADKSLATLERYAGELGQRSREVCLADDTTRERRMACLDERAAELAGLVDAFAGADRVVVARAVSAAAQLRPVATCDEAATAGPLDGATPELAMRAAQARALLHAGRFAAATDAATAIASEARRRGDRRHELDALLLLGDLELEQDKPTAGTTLSQAVEVGEAIGRDADVEIALELLAFDSAGRAHDYAAAHRLQRLAAAKLARAGRTDGKLGDVVALDGTILQMEGHLAPAEAALRKGLALQEAAYGLDNPVLTPTIDRLAIVLGALGRNAEALVLDERAAAIRERTYGPDHPRLVAGLVDLAGSLSAVGRDDEARARLLRADAIARAAYGADGSQRFYPLDNLGLLEKRRGQFEAAETALQTALAIAQHAMGSDSAQAGEVLEDLGEVAMARGQPGKAALLYERALPIMEHALGRDHRQIGELLTDLGEAYVELHRADQAVPILERALKLRPDETPGHLAPPRFLLARALWDAGRDRPRAIALARQAAEAQIAPGEGVTQAEISAWVAAHAPR
ncbi:MAG TPA: serine/threonine-protein kinase [Kofleriaceae bacterium]|jgi:tetratricopeptide (TPR) repeat protein/predicted Ser/Thr protein kinase|nr:serine/threonine-protein kinase [Kofleriaceae bacterium]